MMAILVCLGVTREAPRPTVIEVACPPAAILYVDDHRVRQMGPARRLTTPPLPPGERYFYTLRLEEGGRETLRRRIDFAAGQTLYVDLQAPALEAHNYGIDIGRLHSGAAAKASLNGKPISLDEARRLMEARLADFGLRIEGSSRLELGDDAPNRDSQAARLAPIDGGKRRLTLIGPAEACQKVLAELAGPLRELAGDYHIKHYRPDHWAVAKAGFVTAGSPTIYAQTPDGTVLFRQDDGVELRKNLEAVRRPHPDYRPELDPDYRKAGAAEASGLPLASAIAAALLLLAGWRD